MSETEIGTQKTRKIFGFTFQTTGIIAPGEPVRATLTMPKNATFHCIQVDGAGNFVVFAECWSHPKGTKVTHNAEDWLILQDHDIPAGWEYVETIMTMNKGFHFFRKGTPKLVLASV